MKFSVIIPLYNKAPYVTKAIGSVLAQTFTNYELVIVDDGSQDDSFDVALKAIEGKTHCHIYHQQNAGVSMARNNGVAFSRGDYLCFLDADDWWDPAFLEEMSRLIDEYPDAGVYGTNYIIVDETKHKTRAALVGVEDGFEKGYINYCQVYAKTLYMPLTSITVAIPRPVFQRVGGYTQQLKMGEDFDLWIRIYLKYRVVFLNKPLAYYNQDVDVKHRAIGSLPDPSAQFAFHADYLKADMEQDEGLRMIVEYVQIVCLRSYYLSRKYHVRAMEVLDKIKLDAHKGQSYINYLLRPVWFNRLMYWMIRVVGRMRYGK